MSNVTNTATPSDLAAQKLQSAMQESLSPAMAAAAMTMLEFEVEEVCLKALIGPRALNGWLDGTLPILTGRQPERLGMVLGFEGNRLYGAHSHFFVIDASAKKLDAKKLLTDFSPALKGSRVSIICDTNGNDSWDEKSQYYAVRDPNGTWAIFVHINRGRFSGTLDFPGWAGVHWASYGAQGKGGRSEILISDGLADQLFLGLPDDDALEAMIGAAEDAYQRSVDGNALMRAAAVPA